MADNNSLTLVIGGSTKDLITNYSAYVLEDTSRPQDLEPENVTTQEWYGVSGEEVYIPSNGIVFKAYDWKCKLGIKGTKADVKSKFDSLKTDLARGTMTITIPYYNVTLNGCYLKNIEQDDSYFDDTQGFITFEVTFRVTEP